MLGEVRQAAPYGSSAAQYLVRSSLYVHFSEVSTGLVHLRAYGLQERLLDGTF